MTEDKDIYYKSVAQDYINNAVILNDCNAAIVVEADEDEMFWTKVFKYYLPQYSFCFFPFSKTPNDNCATGSSNCLRYLKLGCLSKEFFICIDSDYKYLLQEKDRDIEHFVFQTYTYSIENHYCYCENTANIFEKYGFDNELMDIKELMEKISELLYLPLLHNLLLIGKNGTSNCESAFRALISDINFSKLTTQEIIDDFTNKVKEFENKYRITETNEIKELAKKCAALGLNKENAYLYVRGHNIYPSIVKLIKSIRERKEKDIAQDFSNEEKAKYFSRKDRHFENNLNNSICFDKYDEIKKIKADTEKYIQLS